MDCNTCLKSSLVLEEHHEHFFTMIAIKKFYCNVTLWQFTLSAVLKAGRDHSIDRTTNQKCQKQRRTALVPSRQCRRKPQKATTNKVNKHTRHQSRVLFVKVGEMWWQLQAWTITQGTVNELDFFPPVISRNLLNWTGSWQCMYLLCPQHWAGLICFKFSQSDSNGPHWSVCFSNFVYISLFG